MKGQSTVHVGLGAHLLSRQAGYRQAGIHNYIRHLIQHLPGSDPSFRYSIFAGWEWNDAQETGGALSWRVSRWPTERPWVRVAWEQVVQPWSLYQAGVHLMHALAFVSPFVRSVPAVVTIHDLSFLRFPERFRPANRLYLTTMTRLSCRYARRVIAVSQATADEIVRLLHVPAERIDVVSHGIQHARFRPLPAGQVKAFRREKGLPDRFVFYLGTLEPRKNLATLIEAFARTKALRHGVKLIIAGGKGWYYDEIFRRVEELDLTDVVWFTGFLPDAELPLWYNAGTVFAYPSLYEGFGMPLLEAMACRTPVVASNVSCLPEVVGDAGCLVAPYDVAGFAENLERLLSDANLREEFAQRGWTRAAAYTWEATAAATVASYRRALAIADA